MAMPACDDVMRCVGGSQDIERLTSPERDYHASIRFTYYLQYHLHAQLLDASQHAARLRIALKGDLPIGDPLLPLPLVMACIAEEAPLMSDFLDPAPDCTWFEHVI